MNSEENIKTEVVVGVENDGETSVGDMKSEQDKTESTFNAEEYAVLKEKVEKLEELLSKCRGTIVNNKEKVKRLSEDKEGIQSKFERQLDQIKLQYEQELNTKFEGLQAQIQSLTELKDKLQGELNDVINLKGDHLIQKLLSNHEKEQEKSAVKIKSLAAELSELKGALGQSQNTFDNFSQSGLTTDPSTTAPTTSTTSPSADTTTTTKSQNIPVACVNVNPGEHKKVLKMLEARSEELIGVMEERTSLRKELISQRDRFSLILERYDSQMKVVQEELRLRMMPGPVEAGMSEQVVSIMEGGGGDSEVEKLENAGESGAEKGKKSNPPVEKGDAEGKVVKLLVLLEKCARKADDKEAECGRWSGRYSELTEKHQKCVSEAEETTKRLEKQVSEMTIKENDLNEELEKTRSENGDMLRAQRSEMGDLQKVVDRLVSNEEFLKTQMNDIKGQCDSEVARANAENEAEMNKLKVMFDENKKAVSELFEQLTQSKQKSNEVVKELENELDYRYRQLDAARTYINCLSDGKTPPTEPTLEAIFSNMPNFIYVDDVANGSEDKNAGDVGDGAKGNGEKKDKMEGEKKNEDVSKVEDDKKKGEEKLKNAEKNKKNITKSAKNSKK